MQIPEPNKNHLQLTLTEPKLDSKFFEQEHPNRFNQNKIEFQIKS